MNSGTRYAAKRPGYVRADSTFLSAVDELASVRAFRGSPLNVPLLVAVRVVELDFGDRGTTPRVVDQILHDAADETIALSKVQGAQACGALAVLRV